MKRTNLTLFLVIALVMGMTSLAQAAPGEMRGHNSDRDYYRHKNLSSNIEMTAEQQIAVDAILTAYEKQSAPLYKDLYYLKLELALLADSSGSGSQISKDIAELKKLDNKLEELNASYAAKLMQELKVNESTAFDILSYSSSVNHRGYGMHRRGFDNDTNRGMQGRHNGNFCRENNSRDGGHNYRGGHRGTRSNHW